MFAVHTLAACDEPAEQEPKVNVPAANVDLPEVPADLGESAIPVRHPDGSLSVDGLKRNRHAYLEKEVSVKGQIVWIYECPYERPKKKKRGRKPKADAPVTPRCQRAHLYIADTAGEGQVRLLVVGLPNYLQEHFDNGEIKVGGTYTMTGTYADIGAGFANPEEGLLHLGKIAGFEPPPEGDTP